MFQRLVVRTLIVPLVLLITAGCSSPQRHEPQDGRVVLIYAVDRSPEATKARDALQALGFRVHMEPEGPAVRTRSVVAVYSAGHHEGRVPAIEDTLAPIVDVEMRPFPQPGPDGTDVVLWLVSHDRENSAPIPMPELEDAPTK